MSSTRATCPRCDYATRARWPKGGDGTAVIIGKHNVGGSRAHNAVPCSGSYATADAGAVVTR